VTRTLRLLLAVVLAAATIVVVAGSDPARAAGANPIDPDNRASAIDGETNGDLPPNELLQLAPTCLAYYRAAPSLVSLIAAAHRDGIRLAPAECYRDYDGQVKERQDWCARGACEMAAVPGTSNHGWGKAVDFNDQNGSLTFDGAAYAWLKAHAGWFGWNHPGVMDEGGPVPEPWHWEWVGDGGRMYPGMNFGYGNGFGIPLGGDPSGHLDTVGAAGLNGWSGTAPVAGWAIDPDTTGSTDVHVYVDGSFAAATRANQPRSDIAQLFAGYDSSPHGFATSVGVLYGKREVCAYGINSFAPGANTLLNCTVATIGQDPIGAIDTVATTTGISVRGWALDADLSGSIDVHAYVNGVFAGAVTANGVRPDVDALFPRNGSGHGFDMTVPAQQGPQTICLYGIDSGPGSNALIGCRTLTSDRDPFGYLDAVRPAPGGLTVSGWAIDPDSANPIQVHTYIDGQGAGATTAGGSRPDIGAAFPLYGPAHGYTATYPAGPGAHNVCTFGINVAAGTNTLLECKTIVL
jgi:D-alanyl-D-alanine carboxypeptidase